MKDTALLYIRKFADHPILRDSPNLIYLVVKTERRVCRWLPFTFDPDNLVIWDQWRTTAPKLKSKIFSPGMLLWATPWIKLRLHHYWYAINREETLNWLCKERSVISSAWTGSGKPSWYWRSHRATPRKANPSITIIRCPTASGADRI